MPELTEFVRSLTQPAHREAARVPVEIPVEILVIRQKDDVTEPVYVKAVIHDVSSGGALLSTSESLARQHIWLRFPGSTSQRRYVEAEVVRRVEPQIPLAHSYGVRFAKLMKPREFGKLIAERWPVHQQSVAGPLVVSVGDVIELTDFACE